jgi:hypothetical protein
VPVKYVYDEKRGLVKVAAEEEGGPPQQAEKPKGGETA